MEHGEVKWFSAEKGYGFIAPDVGDADVFVHISVVERAGLVLTTGDRVIFEPEITREGRVRACEIAMDV